ncbi:tRNA-i(6)A37 methylthiotransferase [Clostridiaceae bacterium JG1575]|nr:tRNA-i(6)A37 methylthiotransferase [Clostridiaceae bacterium JG1575]
MKKEGTNLLIPGTPALRALRSSKEAFSADPKAYYIETWGCQMNEEDSEKLAGMLEQMGYRPVGHPQKAQCIIFNTCCVRENAELKVYGNLGRLKKLKEEHPQTIIAVCGCMMQQKGVGEAILKRYPYVDIVFGTHHAERFPEYLHRALQSGEQIFEVHEDDGTLSEGVPILRESGLKAYVTIMYGCDNYCSYCVVPYVRGREKSRTSEAILAEIRALVEEGYVEFTLLGQNVNSYGKGLEPYVSFAELLRKVNEVPGVSRIRFMTNHPKDIDEEVIKAMVDCEHITEQIHLPVQSGSSRILARMNRSYTREQYLSLIGRVRSLIPNVAISTDIIVGFPGESEADFQETLSLCEEVGFDAAYTFLYSKRNHTPADRMADQVPEDVKHERFNRLVEVVNRSAAERNAAYLHRVEDILVEGPSKNRPDTLTGRTRSGKTVNFPGDQSLTGTLQPVRITKTNSFSLFGERIEVPAKEA